MREKQQQQQQQQEPPVHALELLLKVLPFLALLVKKSASTDELLALPSLLYWYKKCEYLSSLLYWYKSANTCPACFTGTQSTNTDARLVQLDLDFSQTAAQGASQRAAFETGSQCTCFTGTQVQALTQRFETGLLLDLCSAAALPPSHIRIAALSAGSVLARIVLRSRSNVC
jgi:hypothetical protein